MNPRRSAPTVRFFCSLPAGACYLTLLSEFINLVKDIHNSHYWLHVMLLHNNYRN